MDMAIIRDLFTNTLRAARLLGVDAEFRATLKTALGRLLRRSDRRARAVAGVAGGLRGDRTDHRHVSHLFALHPGDQITPRGTPPSGRRRQHTLELRGDGGTGWSQAWNINFWARLEDGDHASNLLERSRRSPRCPTCSTPTRRSRSTATSAAPPASPRCCCNATPARSTCSPPCPRLAGRLGRGPPRPRRPRGRHPLGRRPPSGSRPPRRPRRHAPGPPRRAYPRSRLQSP